MRMTGCSALPALAAHVPDSADHGERGSARLLVVFDRGVLSLTSGTAAVLLVCVMLYSSFYFLLRRQEIVRKDFYTASITAMRARPQRLPLSPAPQSRARFLSGHSRTLAGLGFGRRYRRAPMGDAPDFPLGIPGIVRAHLVPALSTVSLLTNARRNCSCLVCVSSHRRHFLRRAGGQERMCRSSDSGGSLVDFSFRRMGFIVARLFGGFDSLGNLRRDFP